MRLSVWLCLVLVFAQAAAFPAVDLTPTDAASTFGGCAVDCCTEYDCDCTPCSGKSCLSRCVDGDATHWACPPPPGSGCQKCSTTTPSQQEQYCGHLVWDDPPTNYMYCDYMPGLGYNCWTGGSRLAGRDCYNASETQCTDEKLP